MTADLIITIGCMCCSLRSTGPGRSYGDDWAWLCAQKNSTNGIGCCIRRRTLTVPRGCCSTGSAPASAAAVVVVVAVDVAVDAVDVVAVAVAAAAAVVVAVVVVGNASGHTADNNLAGGSGTTTVAGDGDRGIPVGGTAAGRVGFGCMGPGGGGTAVSGVCHPQRQTSQSRRSRRTAGQRQQLLPPPPPLS